MATPQEAKKVPNPAELMSKEQAKLIAMDVTRAIGYKPELLPQAIGGNFLHVESKDESLNRDAMKVSINLGSTSMFFLLVCAPVLYGRAITVQYENKDTGDGFRYYLYQDINQLGQKDDWSIGPAMALHGSRGEERASQVNLANQEAVAEFQTVISQGWNLIRLIASANPPVIKEKGNKLEVKQRSMTILEIVKMEKNYYDVEDIYIVLLKKIPTANTPESWWEAPGGESKMSIIYSRSAYEIEIDEKEAQDAVRETGEESGISVRRSKKLLKLGESPLKIAQHEGYITTKDGRRFFNHLFLWREKVSNLPFVTFDNSIFREPEHFDSRFLKVTALYAPNDPNSMYNYRKAYLKLVGRTEGIPSELIGKDIPYPLVLYKDPYNPQIVSLTNDWGDENNTETLNISKATADALITYGDYVLDGGVIKPPRGLNL